MDALRRVSPLRGEAKYDTRSVCFRGPRFVSVTGVTTTSGLFLICARHVGDTGVPVTLVPVAYLSQNIDLLGYLFFVQEPDSDPKFRSFYRSVGLGYSSLLLPPTVLS